MVEVKCIVCSKIYIAARRNSQYCSNECRNEIRKQNRLKTKEERFTKTCIYCGQPFLLRNKYAGVRALCYDCMPEGVQFSRSDFLNFLRKKQGGRCIVCGYSRYLGALDFHHIEPSKKELGIGNSNFRLEEAIKEIEKCVLLCSNCHREYHAGLIKLEDYII